MKACAVLTTGAGTQLAPDKCELTYLLCLGPIPALRVLLAAGWGVSKFHHLILASWLLLQIRPHEALAGD